MPRSKTQPPKRSSTSGSKEISNQKKTKKSLEKQNRLYLNSFIYEVIGENIDGNKTVYHCNICPTKPKLDFRSIYRHILNNETH